MCDDDINQWTLQDSTLSRRTFGLGAAATVGVAAAAHAQAAVVEKEVNIKTADGTADAVLYYPQGQGPWPAVLIWTDIFGLRPVFRAMGRRLAAQGYTVLVPNPFYRSAKASETSPVSGDPEARQGFFAMRGEMGGPAGAATDAKAYIGFLDAQSQTDKTKMAGVQGYCMGGPLCFQTAGAVPDRIGAVGTFHGGGLVRDTPDSPHLLVAKTKATYLIAVAKNDDARAPNDKEVLRKTFAETGRPATVKVYDGNHGWCVRGSAVYNEAAAEKAWAELTKLYKTALV